jgi:hypothetical protein
MSKFQQPVSRYQLTIFFLLTYLISWSIVVPFDGGIMPQGPMFAAFIVLAIVAGRQGTSELWWQMTRWRVGWHWYLIAPGIVVVFHLCALAVNLLLGASIASTSHLQPVSYLSGILVPLLLLMGGEWEEPGWTGYALPRFQERFSRSPLLATLAVGVFRMIWHTPLLIYGAIPWYDFVFYSFATQLMITWLYNRTGGSVLIAMLFHLASNILPATMIPLFADMDQEPYRMLFVAFACVIALGILVATKTRLGRELITAELEILKVEQARLATIELPES